MVATVDRNRNSNVRDGGADDPVITEVLLNAFTAVTVFTSTAKTVNLDFNNNDASFGFWLRPYPAAQDDLKHGIFISNKNGARPFYQVPPDSPYIGEWSAISDNDGPTCYVTSW